MPHPSATPTVSVVRHPGTVVHADGADGARMHHYVIVDDTTQTVLGIHTSAGVPDHATIAAIVEDRLIATAERVVGGSRSTSRVRSGESGR